MAKDETKSEKRENITFWIKTTFYVAGVLASVVFSASHLALFDAEKSLQSKLRSSTELFITNLNENGNSPVYMGYGEHSEDYFCEISGSYKATNTGEYNYFVGDVSFELLELPYIRNYPFGSDEAVSFSMSERITGKSRYKAKTLIEGKAFPVGEGFAPGNMLERSFGFIIPLDTSKDADKHKPSSRYVVVANATAAINEDQYNINAALRQDNKDNDNCPMQDLWITERLGITPPTSLCFHKNDLRHVSGTLNCEIPGSPDQTK